VECYKSLKPNVVDKLAFQVAQVDFEDLFFTPTTNLFTWCQKSWKGFVAI
jgi:hypothetical protein